MGRTYIDPVTLILPLSRGQAIDYCGLQYDLIHYGRIDPIHSGLLYTHIVPGHYITGLPYIINRPLTNQPDY